MLSCLAVFSFLVFVISMYALQKADDWSGSLYILTLAIVVLSAGCASVSFIKIYNLFVSINNEAVLDQKIEMYQEENSGIEHNIDTIIEEYLAHEHDTFVELAPDESSINLVTLYPELKSDSLVQQQLEVYVANNEKIRTLREEKIELSKSKWLLYFGH